MIGPEFAGVMAKDAFANEAEGLVAASGGNRAMPLGLMRSI